jgi:hypothetical protein
MPILNYTVTKHWRRGTALAILNLRHQMEVRGQLHVLAALPP